jgi:beta-glucanase (GH16 family)
MTIAAADSDFFLHHGANNSQNHSYAATDLTQWHDYAVEWTATGIRGYIDGTKFFEDTNLSHLPPGAMHQTIQLDWFPSGTTATTPSSMNVAWVRQYAV